MMRAFLRTVVFMLVSYHLTASIAEANGPIRLTDVTSQTGIDFVHTDGSGGQYFIVEYVSAGIALFDYDNDGLIDIYFLNGMAMPGSTETHATNRLYRNEGNWRFRDVTAAAGVGDTGHGLGVTVGDYDNDGDADLYLNNFGPNVLYRNNGDGTFTNVTAAAGVANGDRVGAGTCFVDVDADGDLDLFVANYIKFEFAQHKARTMHGFPVYGSPLDYQSDADTLFENQGDGTFRDVSQSSGIAAKAAYGMGVVCSDYDQDGDSDVLVGNDVGANFVYRNDGRGHFVEVGLLSGFAYDGRGKIQGSMGVECADLDNDGRLDLHATSYQNEHASLYRNLGNGLFDDVSNAWKVASDTVTPVTWGNVLADLDNDGFRDIFIGCGHLYDNVDQFDSSASYRSQNLLFQNQGGKRFVNVTMTAGSGLDVLSSSRGVACDDLDNDGDLDIVVLNSRSAPTLLRNDSPQQGHWLQLDLTAKSGCATAAGTKVEVQCGELRLIDEVRCGRSYQSHFGSRMHFGLGAHNKTDRIIIHWLDGDKQVVESPGIDSLLQVRQP
ncbi:MAG: CRTAC1 family protein [Pirellulaceae bacterium]